jgi:hypothetical protein
MKGLARTKTPIFDHLHRMTDERGLFEHALNDRPRTEHGYCVDDVSRGLVVALHEPLPGLGVGRLAVLYLDFTVNSVSLEGAVRNRMNENGVWTDEPTLEDCWGRALWGLGTAATRAPTATMRTSALQAFRRAATHRSPDLMSMTFAALGAGELLKGDPMEQCALDLLRDFADRIDLTDVDANWPWPEPRLRYSNGHVVQALILAGYLLTEPQILAHGLSLLRFLLDSETLNGHLSMTPVGGRGPNDGRPAFDQQPIEVSALADACAEAYDVTEDDQWLAGVQMAWNWFTGDNDLQLEMFDHETGAGFDGLESDGRNSNQGAESTIAAISTAQQARRLGLLR